MTTASGTSARHRSSIQADPQNGPVDARHPGDRPAFGIAGQDLIDAIPVLGHTFDHRDRVVVDRRLGERYSLRHRRDRVGAPQIGFVEQVDRSIAGFAARAHDQLLTRPR